MGKRWTICFAAAAVSLLLSASALAKGGHHSHGHHHHVWPYGYITYAPAYVEPVYAAPAQIIAPTFRCSYTRDIVTVPSEDGGERQVTITRC